MHSLIVVPCNYFSSSCRRCKILALARKRKCLSDRKVQPINTRIQGQNLPRRRPSRSRNGVENIPRFDDALANCALAIRTHRHGHDR